MDSFAKIAIDLIEAEPDDVQNLPFDRTSLDLLDHAFRYRERVLRELGSGITKSAEK